MTSLLIALLLLGLFVVAIVVVDKSDEPYRDRPENDDEE